MISKRVSFVIFVGRPVGTKRSSTRDTNKAWRLYACANYCPLPLFTVKSAETKLYKVVFPQELPGTVMSNVLHLKLYVKGRKPLRRRVFFSAVHFLQCIWHVLLPLLFKQDTEFPRLRRPIKCCYYIVILGSGRISSSVISALCLKWVQL